MEQRKWFVIEITTVNGETAKAVWEHSTEEEAKSHYYQILAGVYANSNLTYALCMIINDIGYCQKMERIPEYIEE